MQAKKYARMPVCPHVIGDKVPMPGMNAVGEVPRLTEKSFCRHSIWQQFTSH